MNDRPPHPTTDGTVPESEENRRDELCRRLAENLHDLGATEFSQEIKAGEGKFLIRVIRY